MLQQTIVMCDADKEIRSVLNEKRQVKERAMKKIFYQLFRHNSIKGKNGTRVGRDIVAVWIIRMWAAEESDGKKGPR